MTEHELTMPIPQTTRDFWEGTTGVKCRCGGTIEWAEAGYSPGARACRGCLTLFAVRGEGGDRRLVPQTVKDGIICDAQIGDEPEKVPANLYPGWTTNAKTGNEIKVFWDQEAHRGRGMWAATINGTRVKCPEMPDEPTTVDFEDAIATLAHCHDVPEPAEGWGGSVAVDGLSAQYIAIDD